MSEYTKYRLLEILPGLLVWVFLIGGAALAFLKPMWLIYYILIFDIYWVFRVIYFSFYLIVAWRRFRRSLQTDWLTLVKTKTGWEEIVHCIFLPLYNEDEEVVRTTLNGIIANSYPSQKMIVVLAGEERQKEHFKSFAQKIAQEFRPYFRDFILTLHPAGLSGEIPGKGSNLHFAGHRVREYVDAHQIPYDKIIVSAFDIDTIVHRHYFACLTHTFLTHPNPTRVSYQPVALYNNNIWESPAILRIMAFGTTFWILFAQARPDSLVTFSSHSMSFRALVDVNFWAKDIVSEDSRIFWQCLLHYGGEYSVVPLYLPVSMDTVRDDSWWRSIVNLYKQQRRWAWGVEHVPYLLWNFWGNKRIKLFERLRRAFNQWEGKFSWATTSFTILLFGRLPLWVAAEEVRKTVLFENTPHILEWLMIFAMSAILISIILSLTVLPHPPKETHSHRKLIMILQWLLLPVSLILVSAIPAIDATTRLMFGKYLGFNVSQKKRETRPPPILLSQNV
ncbi:MAG: conserved rane protein of unknown function [Candidatus Magasanikbacteria bacterium]|nr:conserved rane protein of unknown function [Candidatus Magasanikbacteria bacterium]